MIAKVTRAIFGGREKEEGKSSTDVLKEPEIKPTKVQPEPEWKVHIYGFHGKVGFDSPRSKVLMSPDEIPSTVPKTWGIFPHQTGLSKSEAKESIIRQYNEHIGFWKDCVCDESRLETYPDTKKPIKIMTTSIPTDPNKLRRMSIGRDILDVYEVTYNVADRHYNVYLYTPVVVNLADRDEALAKAQADLDLEIRMWDELKRQAFERIDKEGY